MSGRVQMLPKTVISRCLKYLHEEVKAPWDWRTAAWAAANGHLHILEYLVERKYDKYDEYACECAAENGHLDCLKYLHETAKAPWNYSRRTSSAREQTSRLCTIPPRQRLSLPHGWRYEDGELHVPKSRNRIRNRMRNRIRIITHVLKPPHPCNTKERKRETHNKTLYALSLQLSLSRNSTLNLANSC